MKPFRKKMKHLVKELNGQFAESAKLEQAIKVNLKEIGFTV
jgi:type I restriction enzyme M protein